MAVQPFTAGVYPSQIIALHRWQQRRPRRHKPAVSFPDAATLANPIQLMVESKGNYLYVANQGNNVTGTTSPQSGIAGYFINKVAVTTFFNLPYHAHLRVGRWTAVHR